MSDQPIVTNTPPHWRPWKWRGQRLTVNQVDPATGVIITSRRWSYVRFSSPNRVWARVFLGKSGFSFIDLTVRAWACSPTLLRIRWDFLNIGVLSHGCEIFFHEDHRERWSRTKTENCVDRRRKRTNPGTGMKWRNEMIGTIEERKRMVAPFAQRTSSENNIGDRLRRFFHLSIEK